MLILIGPELTNHFYFCQNFTTNYSFVKVQKFKFRYMVVLEVVHVLIVNGQRWFGVLGSQVKTKGKCLRPQDGFNIV